LSLTIIPLISEQFLEFSIPTDSSYVFWFRISRELLGLDEDVVCGIVYIPPEYTVYSSVDAFSELENEYLALQRNYR
jgi:hypothetical protein